MTVLLPTLAVAFAAFCIWLTVRIVNRRERWAKWTGVALIVVLSYPLSFGPACWIISHRRGPSPVISTLYAPVIFAWWKSPRPVELAILRYLTLHRGGHHVQLRVSDIHIVFQ